MERKEYKCELTGSEITYIVHEEQKIADINFKYVNYKYVKGFLVLLRTSIDEMKRDGVKLIRQNVTEKDWETILKDKTSWEKILVETRDNSLGVIIMCKIEDFLENVGVGMGIKNIII